MEELGFRCLDKSQCALGSKMIDNFACFRFRDAWVTAWVPKAKEFFCVPKNAYNAVGSISQLSLYGVGRYDPGSFNSSGGHA